MQFHRFKAFNTFTLHMRRFNILVGPNNAGKSTIITAFRILAAAMRKASTRKPEIIRGPQSNTYGYQVDLADLSIAEENIFYNYDDSEPALVTFKLSNGNQLVLYFPEVGARYLIATTLGRAAVTPKSFRIFIQLPDWLRAHPRPCRTARASLR